MSKHFIERCVCGVVISQCRCPAIDKTIRIVEPCSHVQTSARKLEELIAQSADISRQLAEVANLSQKLSARTARLARACFELHKEVSKNA